MSFERVNLEQRYAEHRVVLRFKLAEPLTLAEGKWINRRGADGRHGYWLPWEVTEVEVSGRWWMSVRGVDEPSFTLRGYGHVVTRAGARGADYNCTFGRSTEIPAELIAVRAEIAETMRRDHGWPLWLGDGR